MQLKSLDFQNKAFASGSEVNSKEMTVMTLGWGNIRLINALDFKLRDQDRHELRRRYGKVDRAFHQRARTTLSIELVL